MIEQFGGRLDRRQFVCRAALFAGALATGSSLREAYGATAPGTTTAPKNRITLKLATIAAPNFPYVDGAKKWKELLEKETSGEIELQIFDSGQLGDEKTINEGVLAGSIQAGIGAGAWAGYVPQYNVVELPFLIKNLRHMYRLADAKLGQKLSELAEQKGFRVLAWYSTGNQHFQTKSKRVTSLADFKGLKMRVLGNPAIVAGFEALGAVPQAIAYNQIYTALQQGTIDGCAVDALSVLTLKLTEVVRYLTISGYLAEPRPLIMSKAFFNGLSKDFQNALVKTAKQSAVYERQVFENKLKTALDELRKQGMTILQLSDRDKWVGAMRPVWQKFASQAPGNDELIKIIETTS